VRFPDAEPPCQSPDVVDAVRLERRPALARSLGDVARGIPGPPAFPPQRRERLGQQIHLRLVTPDVLIGGRLASASSIPRPRLWR
jgi:hypothetical protein